MMMMMMMMKLTYSYSFLRKNLVMNDVFLNEIGKEITGFRVGLG
jgi:hypothetical protein